MSNLLLIAFSTGFAGSLHCIGMCGPLLLAMPFHGYEGFKKISTIFLYHTGRVVAYGLVGLIAGFFGDALLLFGIGNWLSLTIGIGFLFILMIQKRSNLKGTGFQWIVAKLHGTKRNMLLNFFILGLLNGFLPCGMVYAALAIAVTSGTAFTGSLTMIAFGLGTLPLLLYVTIGYSKTLVRVRGVIQQKSFLLQLMIACLLILRGLHLGIPFVSPEPVEQIGGVLVRCFK